MQTTNGAPPEPVGAGTVAIANATAADFAQPVWECDMVMQGGITSGIVYPATILRIAQRFRLKTIGGTSAGAIAAAAAAAAEFRRVSDPQNPGAGYELLKTNVMQWLGQGTNLQSLFVPVWALAPLFWTFLWLLGVFSAMRRFSIKGAVNLVVTLIVKVLAVYGAIAALFGSPAWPLFETARIVAIAALALVVLSLIQLVVILPLYGFGVCSGGKRGTVPNLLHPHTEPLTFWLAKQIDTIAGMPGPGPLTYGDLWAGHVRAAAEDVTAAERDPKIALRMVTTSITLGRPFSFPLTSNIFYFRSDDMRRLFPEYVVDWLEKHPRKADPNDPNEPARHDFLKDQGYLPLPSAEDMPVIISTRMSLSFPILLAAVRLWAIDWQQQYNKDNPTRPKIEPVWFSDGGVSSNFPIGLFDPPLPVRPSLGISFGSIAADVVKKDPSKGVSMANDNKELIASTWTRFADGGLLSKLPGFAGAIVNAMQNWQDTMQSEAPGFRDRIAHVLLTSSEGGLNLTMPPTTIATLQQRGELAGKMLLDHFADPPAPGIITTWDNHRRVMLRTTLDVTERYAQAFASVWKAPGMPPGQPDYPHVLDEMRYGPDGYPWVSPQQYEEAKKVAGELADLAHDVPSDVSVSYKAPRPAANLHARPKF
ncbi:MAG TPA: hypothetical protein VK669_09070 [Candidatus Limnocylindrales bacterium]|nr:hypothetical protein [Candidatus Limnocylindrales bacterium]